MPTLRKKSAALESSANPKHRSSNEQAQTNQTQMKCQYEQSREERIRENLERMKKLGIADISLQLKAQFQPKRATKSCSNRSTTPSGPSPMRPTGPIRRSSRLQNATPVSYSEVHLGEKLEAVEEKSKGIRLEEGAKPEIYTEEHDKLLGNTEKSWTLFVDGYGKDGKRIYDAVRGKTCHQCRQKTLGHHTHCSNCNMVQGQFCGDCLYMRYGEHVLEAVQNPDWICPVCRGICNCSLCRNAKGWAPTGVMYKKISQLGFKSVAHYLIQTRRSQTYSGQNPETTTQVSAKRSLPFQDMDASCKENLKVDYSDLGSLTPLGGREDKRDDEFKKEKENEMQRKENQDMNTQTSAKRSLYFPDIVQQSEKEVDVNKILSEKEVDVDKILSEKEVEKENGVLFTDNQHDRSTALNRSSKLKKKKRALVAEPDSIAGRLRRRRIGY